MATTLQNTLRFTGLVLGVPQLRAHGINIDGLARTPWITIPNRGPFTVAVDSANVYVTRIATSPGDTVDVWVYLPHTAVGVSPAPTPTFSGLPTNFPFVAQMGTPPGAETYPPARVIQVDPTKVVSTIAAGLAAAAALVPVPSSTAPALVLVAPSVYPEANPLVVPDGVTLLSNAVDNPSSVVVTPTVAATALFSITSGGSVGGLTALCTGVAGVTAFAMTAAGAGTRTIRFCRCFDAAVGLDVAGVGVVATAQAFQAFRTAVGGVGTVGVRVSGGAVLRGSTVQVIGDPAAVWTDGVLATGAGSSLQLATATISRCIDGLEVAAAALLVAFQVTSTFSTNGFHASGGTLRTFGCDVEDTTAFDVLIDAGATWFDAVSIVDELKRSVDPTAIVGAASMSQATALDENALSLLAQLHVGSERFPCESAFGQGDAHIRGLRAFRSVVLDAGPFTDITSALISPSGSTAAVFDTGVVGNAFFLGGDVAFPSIELDTVTAINLGAGALVFEISNGAGGWIVIRIMAADDHQPPFTSYAQDIFGRVAIEAVRFGDTSLWAPQAINGVSKYWFRVRVITAPLGVVPVLEQAQLGTSRTEISGAGVIEHYGQAEVTRDLVMHQRLFDDLAGASPGNVTIAFSPNVSITPIENLFSNGVIDGVGAIVTVPDGLDTSRTVELDVHWKPSVATAGNVEFETNLVQIKVGDVVDGTAAEVAGSVIEPVAIGQEDVLFFSHIDFDISDLAPHDQFAFSLFRDATGGNPDDTLVGNVEIVSVRMTGTFWR